MDTTLATFERDVIDASLTVPVLVDFWAPWCEPCKTLGPMLEKLEVQDGGRWRLVKVNVDENRELAAHFNTRSIPHVVAFSQGQAVDQFLGVLSEGELREFIARLLPATEETERHAAHRALAEGQPELAFAHLQKALQMNPEYDDARLDLIEWLLQSGQAEAAREALAHLTPRATQGTEPRYEAVKARFAALDAAAQLPPTDALEARIAADPGDLDARFDLAQALIAHGAFDGALAQLLDIVQRDRTWRDELARKTMISVFGMAAHDPQLVSTWRRKLGAALN